MALFAALQLLCVRAQTLGDAQWDYRFAIAGVPDSEGMVGAMAFDGTNIYIGGSFQSAGYATCQGVARFDGQQLQALPPGPQQELPLVNVLAMEMFEGQLWVGGLFPSVAGVPSGGLARWHGTNGSVPGGATGEVYAITKDTAGLLVAGKFWLPGWSNPVALARWNGKEWTLLNSELPPCGPDDPCLDAVDQVVTAGKDIYASLSFHTPDDPYYPKWLAQCDQSNNWWAVSAPDASTALLNRYVIAAFQGQLVAGGSFTNATNAAIRNVAIYDGTNWQPLAQGLEYEVCGMTGNDRFLYVSHRAVPYGQVPAYTVSRWDGTHWSQVGTNHFRTDSPNWIFLGPDETVYLTGAIGNTEDSAVPGLARWAGERWEPFLHGAYNGLAGYTAATYCLAQHQGSVYIGGVFSAAGTQVTEGLARWDGAKWNSVAGPLQSQRPARIGAMVSSGALLFAAGAFTNIAGVAASNVASWDGAAWSPVGEGLPTGVSTLAWWDGSLYAGGLFEGGLLSSPSSGSAPTIARLTGSTWEPLGDGCDYRVTCLSVWRGNLYAGGSFTNAGGVASPGIASWDGAAWHAVGTGLLGTGSDDDDSPTVNAIVGNEDGFYVGGSFITPGEPCVTNLARWDGSNWHPVGDPWLGEIRDLAVRGRTLFAAGSKTNSLGQNLSKVQQWDGTNWTALGSGVDKSGGKGRPFALLATDEELFVGGLFTTAGGKPSVGVARWIENARLHLDLHRPTAGTSTLVRATSDPGLRFDLEAGPDLSRWTKVAASENGQASWLCDPASDESQHFFRAVARP